MSRLFRLRGGLVAVFGSLALLAASSIAWTANAICVGDCDEDGTVEVNELITMRNLIFAEDPDLSSCENADANNDGQVNVGEFMTAACNDLHSTCDGCEGSSAETVVMTIGTGSAGPGQTTAVPFSVTDAAGVVGVMQLDVGFDPGDVDILVNGSGVPICSAGTAVGSNHTFLASKLVSNPGVRLVVLPNDLVFPLDTLPSDGQFASCNFRVNNFPAHSTPWALTADLAVAGDDEGVDLAVDANNGAISCCGC